MTVEALQRWPLQTVAQHVPYLLGLAFDAPLIGVSKRWPNTLHAVDMEAVIDATFQGRAYRSVCGKRGLRLLSDGTLVALWPPRLKGMPDRLTRCRECWEQSGRMRPRTEWKERGEDV